MYRNDLICLAFAALMALTLAGTYVLGENSWMAYLLLVPGYLMLIAMDAPADASPGKSERRGRRGQPVR